MAILEEEKKKFFDFVDSILKEHTVELDEIKNEDKKSKSSLEKEGGEDNMALDEKMAELEKKLQELSDIRESEKKELEDSYKASMEVMKKEISENHKKELEESNKRLEEAEKKLSEKEKDLHKEKVEKKCSELIEKGIWPSVVEKAKKVMLAEVEGAFELIKLDEKTEVSLSEVLYDILDTIPSESRVDLEELGHVNKNTDPNKKYMSDSEVEEYAKENKMTYQEACSVLGKEGKIEL